MKYHIQEKPVNWKPTLSKRLENFIKKLPIKYDYELTPQNKEANKNNPRYNK